MRDYFQNKKKIEEKKRVTLKWHRISKKVWWTDDWKLYYVIDSSETHSVCVSSLNWKSEKSTSSHNVCDYHFIIIIVINAVNLFPLFGVGNVWFTALSCI